MLRVPAQGAGDHPIGVLTLYRDTAGRLTDEQTADSIVVADLLARTMLERQSRGSPGTLADDIGGSNAHRAEVHQASGMIAVQLGVDVSEALVRLRAHAYATNGRSTWPPTSSPGACGSAPS